MLWKVVRRSHPSPSPSPTPSPMPPHYHLAEETAKTLFQHLSNTVQLVFGLLFRTNESKLLEVVRLTFFFLYPRLCAVLPYGVRKVCLC